MRCFGRSLEDRLSRATDALDVLEVGCGAGRFTEVLLSFPQLRVTSLDLSSAVEANRLSFPIDERHRVVQADIEYPPFARGEYFDFVVCLGVIQHTPSPERTIERLLSLVRPGGALVFDHYRPEWRRLTKVTALALRPLVKRLPQSQRIPFCEHLVRVFIPLHRAVRNIPWAQYARSRISPITTYYHVYPMLREDLQREWAVLDTHDGLADWYKHLRTKDQIDAILRKVGAIDVEIAVSDHGIEARCSRPPQT
jgi:SAM-dependent methyltransferase